MTHPSEAPATAPIASFIAELDRLAAAAMADWKVPGVALAVVQHGKLALTRGYGQRDVEASLPMTPATAPASRRALMRVPPWDGKNSAERRRGYLILPRLRREWSPAGRNSSAVRGVVAAILFTRTVFLGR